MSRKYKGARVVLVAVLAASGYTVATSVSAQADSAPTATDVVGVGSDIIQNSLDFIADGDAQSNPGYNSAGNKNRLISFDATADGNGRNAFVDPSLVTKATQLNPTVVLRAGTSPVQRPNGGGKGIAALVNDGKSNGTTGVSANVINFVRSPNLPKSTDQSAAQANLGTPLHTIQFADDKQVIATAKVTNAPQGLTGAEILGIYDGTYKKWSDLPGNSGGSSDAIIPLLPQVGAGVLTVFLNQLAVYNNNQSVTLTGTVRYVQQNDPTTITGLSDAERPDAIVPFPVGRYTLLNSKYFHDPNTPYSVSAPPAALDASGISLQTGDNRFIADLPYYVIFRDSDVDSATPWQPGSDLNWVRTLFFNPGGDSVPYIESAPAQAILRAQGLTPLYKDLDVQTAPS